MTAEPETRASTRQTWHIITSEFPPVLGGVSAYVARFAGALTAAGHPVVVWCPGYDDASETTGAGVTVRRALGAHGLGDLARVDRELSAHESPRRLLLQWVPHGFGWRSMNVALCLWLLKRAVVNGDSVEIMVHEPFHELTGSARQRLAGLVHRAMTVILIRAASRVWVSTPRWQERWRKYDLSRRVAFAWLPIPSSVEPRSAAPRGAPQRGARKLVGSFTGRARSRRDGRVAALEPVVARLMTEAPDVDLLLIGVNSTEVRDEIAGVHEALGARIHATGPLDDEALSGALDSCDVLVQAYPDGVTSRRATLVTALAHGVPVVTNDGPNTEPFWRESGALCLVPAGDPGAVVAATRRLIDMPEERERLRAGARHLYARTFHLDRSVAAVVGERER